MEKPSQDHQPDRPESQDKTRRRDETEFLHHRLTRAIIGGFYAVRSQLGPGFSESIYANALAVILREAGLRVEREVPFEVVFHGVVVGTCRVDLLVESTIVVETKAARALDGSIIGQVTNYLSASRLDVALALNFAGKGEVKRIFGERLRTSG